jgi:GNAT superfamily N-acetyltransferase
MTLSIVSIAERPELARITAAWRWEAFFRRDGASLAEVLERELAGANDPDPMPTVLVLLDADVPVGMVALCLNDLDARPQLNPWLAGLYVEPAHRGKGHGLRLIAALEALAWRQGVTRLHLYTATAVGLYEKAGWQPIDSVQKYGRLFTVMSKDKS